MPAGEPVTVPVPVPSLFTVRVYLRRCSLFLCSVTQYVVILHVSNGLVRHRKTESVPQRLQQGSRLHILQT